MKDFLVGLVSIVALVGLGVLLFFFGEFDTVVHGRYRITIDSDHAVGLRRGSGVELNGVPIGEVEAIAVEQHERFPVRIVALVDRDIAIPVGAVPYATSSLLGGASVLMIETPAPLSSAEVLSTDGSARLTGPIRFQVIEEITSELDARMQPVLEALAKFDELSETYITFGRNLNELVTAQTPADLEAGAEPNLRTMLMRFNSAIGDAQEAFVLARKWLGDDQLRADARDAVAKASALIDSASGTLDRFEQMAAAIETDADEVVKQLVPVADEIAATLAEVQRVTRLAADGEGTVGLLLRNPDLYNSLDDAAKRLDEAIREAKLLIEKIKKEGLPIDL